MKIVTAKFMEEKLKRGYTIEYFTQYFDTTEDLFLESLERTFSSKTYKGYLSRLRKNRKHSFAKLSSSSDLNPNTSELSTVVESSDRLVPDDVIESSAQETTPSAIEVLKSQRETLRSTLNSLELEHRDLVSERASIRNSILALQERLKQLKEQVRECNISLSGLTEDLDVKYTAMQELNVKISEVAHELDETELEISKLEKVSILVFATGEVQLEHVISFELQSDSKVFEKALQCEIAGSLTLNQIRGVVKLYSIVNFYVEQNIRFDILFEESDMEELYNILKKD